MEKSADYANANGLERLDGSQLKGISMSTFKSANIKGEAVGKFVAAIRGGKVAPRSFLLVELLEQGLDPFLDCSAIIYSGFRS